MVENQIIDPNLLHSKIQESINNNQSQILKNIHAVSKSNTYKLKYDNELQLNDKQSKQRTRFYQMTKILQGLKKEDSYQDVLQVNL